MANIQYSIIMYSTVYSDYFWYLADYNPKKFYELITFSKLFICGKLSNEIIINLYGGDANKKKYIDTITLLNIKDINIIDCNVYMDVDTIKENIDYTKNNYLWFSGLGKDDESYISILYQEILTDSYFLMANTVIVIDSNYKFDNDEVYNFKFPKMSGEFVFKDFNKRHFIKYVYRYEIDDDSDSD